MAYVGVLTTQAQALTLVAILGHNACIPLIATFEQNLFINGDPHTGSGTLSDELALKLVDYCRIVIRLIENKQSIFGKKHG